MTESHIHKEPKGNWRVWYMAVIAALALQIAGYYIFMRYYS
ncbi:hypothetical protein [Nemorincola caseinilytica]